MCCHNRHETRELWQVRKEVSNQPTDFESFARERFTVVFLPRCRRRYRARYAISAVTFTDTRPPSLVASFRRPDATARAANALASS